MAQGLISWNTSGPIALRCGRYETLRVIASGGMATVHLARAHGAGGFERLVALKVMHPHIASDPEFVDMFLDEARLAALIHHPNVVGTSDVQEDASGLFLVMDYIEGAALQLILRELWKKGRNVRLDIALRIFLDALAGLHAAHELTDSDGQSLYLVHRDVSPQNILVGTDGVARLTDFGVARARSRLATTHGGQLKGKLTYMAPEQVRSEPIDRRTDIYAAGVVLWELLTGRRLIRGENDAAIVQSILLGVSRSPHEVCPEVPEAIADACMRALCPEAEDRYATAAEFAEALEAAADEAGVHIATARTVAVFVKEQDLHSKPAERRSVPADAPTLPAPCSGDDPTVRERATSPDVDGRPMSSPPPSQASSVVRAGPGGRDRPSRNAAAGVGLALGAGIVAALATAGWLIASMASAPPAADSSILTAQTGGVPLEPPSAVDVPAETYDSDDIAAPAAPKSVPAPSATARERGAEPYARPGQLSERAAPSPTTFRPREL